MYYCNNCDCFCEGEERNEVIEGFLKPYMACEYCKSDDIVEAEECPVCGDLLEPSEIDVCQHCGEKIFEQFWQMLNDLEYYNDGDRGEIVEAMATVFDEFYNKYRFKK